MYENKRRAYEMNIKKLQTKYTKIIATESLEEIIFIHSEPYGVYFILFSTIIRAISPLTERKYIFIIQRNTKKNEQHSLTFLSYNIYNVRNDFW